MERHFTRVERPVGGLEMVFPCLETDFLALETDFRELERGFRGLEALFPGLEGDLQRLEMNLQELEMAAEALGMAEMGLETDLQEQETRLLGRRHRLQGLEKGLREHRGGLPGDFAGAHHQPGGASAFDGRERGSDGAVMAETSLSGRLTAWLLVLVNLIPLAGVWLLDWSLFQIVALYWLENVILGGINLLKMLLCAPDGSHPMAQRAGTAAAFRDGQRAHHAIKVFLMPFFTVHYGIFCLVHGVFVFVLLGKDTNAAGHGLFSGIPAMVEKVAASGGLWVVAALALSHLVSFVWHYLIGGEYRRTDVMTLMAAPYGRIVVLHVAILLGAFAIQALGSPVPMLLLLIAGKTWLDLMMHRKAHRKAAE